MAYQEQHDVSWADQLVGLYAAIFRLFECFHVYPYHWTILKRDHSVTGNRCEMLKFSTFLWNIFHCFQMLLPCLGLPHRRLQVGTFQITPDGNTGFVTLKGRLCTRSEDESSAYVFSIRAKQFACCRISPVIFIYAIRFSLKVLMSQPVSVIKTPQGPLVGPYIFGKTLGTGSTGKVKLAKNLETGEVVAIKIVRKDFLERKPSLKKKMRREISVLKLLSHPNVMGLIDVFEIETHLFLVMEFVDGVELFEYLVRRGALPPLEALDFFHQIICGIEYCHRRLICHRDLKPENLVS